MREQGRALVHRGPRACARSPPHSPTHTNPHPPLTHPTHPHPPPNPKVAQLLLVQPSDTAVLALRLACIAAGTAAPVWAAYKASKSDADAKTKDRALRLAVAAGVVELAEKLLGAPTGLARWRYWPPAKLAVLIWLLLDGAKARAGGAQGMGAGRASSA